MTMLKMLFKEIAHRKGNFLLALVGVIGAVATYSALDLLAAGSVRETTRQMRDMGMNLVILPSDLAFANYQLSDYGQASMPQSHLKRLADTPNIYADHYMGMLEAMIDWHGGRVLLTGILPEVPAIDAENKKAVMYRAPEPGGCFISRPIADAAAVKKGDSVDVAGKTFKIAHVMPANGTKDDLRIWVPLADAQAMLARPGQINVIEALNCRCEGVTMDDTARGIEAVLPGTHVFYRDQIARARTDQRTMIEKFSMAIVSAALAAGVLWVGMLAMLNVRARRTEIGILRALGYGAGRIAVLFFGKAILLGIVGAALGYAGGTALALYLGPSRFPITHNAMTADWNVLVWSLIAAPAAAVVASMLPAVIALTDDPAVTLTKEPA